MSCVKKYKNIYGDWRMSEKIPKGTEDLCEQREKYFFDYLNSLFDISHVNAIKMMKIKEDVAFLELQEQKGRPDCMI